MKNALFLLLMSAIILLNLGCKKDEVDVFGNTEIYLEITGAETLTIDEVITGADYFVDSEFIADSDLLAIDLIRFLGGFSLVVKGTKSGKFKKGTYNLYSDEPSTFRSSSQSPLYEATSGSIEVTNTSSLSGFQGRSRANVNLRFTMADINDPSRIIEIEGHILKFEVKD